MRNVAVSAATPLFGHSIGIHRLQTAYAAEQCRPRQIVDLVLERIAARGQDTVWISRWTDGALHQRAAGATELSNHTAALRMVTMQGGVFGCVATSEAVVAATT